MTSTTRMTTESTQPPKAPASRAEREAAEEAEQRGEDADDERLAAADDEPGQDVAAGVVGAEREARLGTGDGVALRAGPCRAAGPAAGSCGAISGAKMRQQDEQHGDAGPEQEDRVAPQPLPGAGDERDAGALLDVAGVVDA